MSNTRSKLEDQIGAGKIVFDSSPPGTSERLKKELLKENSGTQVTTKLQELVLSLSQLVSTHIRISSLVRPDDTDSHHHVGRAVDVGNEEIANQLLPIVATQSKVQELEIDELIFDAAEAGHAERNKWNYNEGNKHSYSESALNIHRNHIHFSVKA